MVRHGKTSLFGVGYITSSTVNVIDYGMVRHLYLGLVITSSTVNVIDYVWFRVITMQSLKLAAGYGHLISLFQRLYITARVFSRVLNWSADVGYPKQQPEMIVQGPLAFRAPDHRPASLFGVGKTSHSTDLRVVALAFSQCSRFAGRRQVSVVAAEGTLESDAADIK